MKIKLYNNKTIGITGGTGSFGTSFLKHILKFPIKELRILSRDEEKQNSLRYLYSNKNIKFILCDVRDKYDLIGKTAGVDILIHAAALKQVPSCEFFPEHSIKTNILGSLNVAEAAILNKIKNVVLLSTDKAVYPINVMGMSKAIAEKIFVSKSFTTNSTKFLIIRYGNVLASRGSIVRRFIDQAKNNCNLTITNYEMSRFVMTLNNTFELLDFALSKGKTGQTIIQKCKSVMILDLAKSILKIMNKKNLKIDIIGIRHGEKVYEVLASKEEMERAKFYKNFIIINKDSRSLNYENYFDKGSKYKNSKEYNSQTENKITIEEMLNLLKTDNSIKEYVK